jgi:hypothetical protein
MPYNPWRGGWEPHDDNHPTMISIREGTENARISAEMAEREERNRISPAEKHSRDLRAQEAEKIRERERAVDAAVREMEKRLAQRERDAKQKEAKVRRCESIHACVADLVPNTLNRMAIARGFVSDGCYDRATIDGVVSVLDVLLKANGQHMSPEVVHALRYATAGAKYQPPKAHIDGLDIVARLTMLKEISVSLKQALDILLQQGPEFWRLDSVDRNRISLACEYLSGLLAFYQQEEYKISRASGVPATTNVRVVNLP